MKAIYIPQLLKAPEKKESILVDGFIDDLETLTPVRGEVVVTHGGNYLEVFVVAETIVTLACDRCLKQYNHRLSIDRSELIWLNEQSDSWEKLPNENLELENLEESLSPQGYFDVQEWLYQQLCLALPLRKLCDEKCPPISVKSSTSEPLIDSRWQSLAALKNQLL
jgi:uncharacterized protein